MSNSILDVVNLKKYFRVRGSLFKKVKAVDGVTFSVFRGETLGVVGESGSGKSTLGRLITKIIEPTDGKIIFNGIDITKLRGRKALEFRRNVQMVFQDPHTSLNPRMTIASILLEPLEVHGIRVDDPEEFLSKHLLSVGLEPSIMYRYPHELSGGQKQRVSILRAIILKPQLVVLDEPTSALDVSVQAQILELLKDLQKSYSLTYIFISHDIAVVRYMSNRIAVMYLGKIIEIGDSETIIKKPLHPYTQLLIEAIPIPDPKIAKSRKKLKLQGEPPSPINPPSGCRFHPRCPFAMDICSKKEPPTINIGNHIVSCWLYEKR